MPVEVDVAGILGLVLLTPVVDLEVEAQRVEDPEDKSQLHGGLAALEGVEPFPGDIGAVDEPAGLQRRGIARGWP